MTQVLRFSAVLGLGITLIATALTVQPTAWADEDNQPVVIDDSDDPQDIDNRVDGIVYAIANREGGKRVTVLDRNVSQEGHAVDVYVRDKGLIAMIDNGAVCVGRYVVVDGVRTSPTTLDAEGITVDYSTNCHQPPK